MGKQKFDLIAASKKKSYKIITSLVVAVGIILFALGIVLRLSVTRTVTPRSLHVDMSNLEGVNGNYTKVITKDEYFSVDTGTQDKALSTGIYFVLDANARTFLEAIPTAYRAGYFQLKIKDNVEDLSTGTLTIHCGSLPSVTIKITYRDC